MRAGQRNGRSAEMFVAEHLRTEADWPLVMHLAPWEPADLIALSSHVWKLIEIKSSTAKRERYAPLSDAEDALCHAWSDEYRTYHVRREGSSAPWFVRSVV